MHQPYIFSALQSISVIICIHFKSKSVEYFSILAVYNATNQRTMSNHQTLICDADPNIMPFLFEAIFIGLFALIFLVLLTHSLYIEWSKRKDQNFQILSTQSRAGYIALQCLALYWTTSDLIRYIIDPLTSFLPNTIICIVLTYSSKIIPGLFYTVYLSLILLRLINLDGTYLKTSKCTIRILRLLIWTVMGFQIAFVCVDPGPVCLHRLHTSDVDLDEMWYCELLLTANRIFLALGGITMIVLLNLAMGALFARRLQQVVHLMKENHHLNIRLRDIVVQSTILTVTGSISTIVFYGVWAVSPTTSIWLYLDLVINCCVIGLSFPHNRGRYKFLCGFCIKCCWKKFDSPGQELPQLPVVPIRNNMESIGEDIVLELGPGLVPQKREESHVDLKAPRVKAKPRHKWGLLMRKYAKRRPSGSLSASDPEDNDSFSDTHSPSLSSLSEITDNYGDITQKPSEANTTKPSNESLKTSKSNQTEASNNTFSSLDTILRTPTISRMPRSLTDIPMPHFSIPESVVRLLSQRRRASV